MQIGHWSLERAVDRIGSAKRKGESPDEDEVAEILETVELTRKVVGQESLLSCSYFILPPCQGCNPDTLTPQKVLVCQVIGKALLNPDLARCPPVIVPLFIMQLACHFPWCIIAACHLLPAMSGWFASNQGS